MKFHHHLTRQQQQQQQQFSNQSTSHEHLSPNQLKLAQQVHQQVTSQLQLQRQLHQHQQQHHHSTTNNNNNHHSDTEDQELNEDEAENSQFLASNAMHSNFAADYSASIASATGSGQQDQNTANQNQNNNNTNFLMDKNKKLFPQKLWELIHNPSIQHCLRWSQDGQRVYLNRNEFEAYYLKTPNNQFHTQKAISFVRQMNMYGFRKVDDCYYENDNFRRDQQHLLRNMIRRHPNKGLFVSGLEHHQLVAAAAAQQSLHHLTSVERFGHQLASQHHQLHHNHHHHNHHHHQHQQQQHLVSEAINQKRATEQALRLYYLQQQQQNQTQQQQQNHLESHSNQQPFLHQHSSIEQQLAQVAALSQQHHALQHQLQAQAKNLGQDSAGSELPASKKSRLLSDFYSAAKEASSAASEQRQSQQQLTNQAQPSISSASIRAAVLAAAAAAAASNGTHNNNNSSSKQLLNLDQIISGKFAQNHSRTHDNPLRSGSRLNLIHDDNIDDDGSNDSATDDELEPFSTGPSRRIAGDDDDGDGADDEDDDQDQTAIQAISGSQAQSQELQQQQQQHSPTDLSIRQAELHQTLVRSLLQLKQQVGAPTTGTAGSTTSAPNSTAQEFLNTLQRSGNSRSLLESLASLSSTGTSSSMTDPVSNSPTERTHSSSPSSPALTQSLLLSNRKHHTATATSEKIQFKSSSADLNDADDNRTSSDLELDDDRRLDLAEDEEDFDRSSKRARQQTSGRRDNRNGVALNLARKTLLPVVDSIENDDEKQDGADLEPFSHNQVSELDSAKEKVRRFLNDQMHHDHHHHHDEQTDDHDDVDVDIESAEQDKETGNKLATGSERKELYSMPAKKRIKLETNGVNGGASAGGELLDAGSSEAGTSDLGSEQSANSLTKSLIVEICERRGDQLNGAALLEAARYTECFLEILIDDASLIARHSTTSGGDNSADEAYSTQDQVKSALPTPHRRKRQLGSVAGSSRSSSSSSTGVIVDASSLSLALKLIPTKLLAAIQQQQQQQLQKQPQIDIKS